MRDDMVTIPSRILLIGSPEPHLDTVAGEQHYTRDWFEDETPQHTVATAGFLLDRHLVTNDQFTAFVTETGYRTEAETRGYGLVYGRTYWETRPGACWHAPPAPAAI